MQSSFWKYFGPATILTLLVVGLAFTFGNFDDAVVVMILGVLELSLSVDNAVVNATKLKTLSPAAQRWFMYYGIIIAVFFMRFAFPILVVSIVGHVGPLSTVSMAIHDPKQYSTILEQAHPMLSAFGATFLFMIFANYFINPLKEVHWLPPLELPLVRLGRWEAIKTALALVLLVGMDYWIYGSWRLPEARSFFYAGLAGLISYVLVESLEMLTDFIEKKQQRANAGKAVVINSLKMAIPALLYLEVVDASMSFDGVMGAFALSSNIFVIMAGLGIGAFWVRSLTLVAIKEGTLAEFRYLENGAFWAIGTLSILLFVSTKVELPDWFVGLLSAGIIGASVLSSIRARRQEAALA